MKKLLLVCVVSSFLSTQSTWAEQILGPSVQWQPLTLEVEGETTNESAVPSPFLRYRLDVTFTHIASNTEYKVPGYYAGDGQGNGSGDKWHAKFTPPTSGDWSYSISLRRGTDIAVNPQNSGTAVGDDGRTGTFTVAVANTNAEGFLSKGRLLADLQTYYFKFNNGEHWIKTGADSPENFLAYNGFDGSSDSVIEGLDIGLPNYKFHTYETHEDDWNNGDPNWTDEDGDEGKGIIGALNYLSEKGVNSIFALLMNIGGDAKDVYPFIAEPGSLLSRGDNAGSEGSKQANNNYWYDISKLYQWNIVFAHAQRKGIALHLVFNEGEQQNKEELDNALLGNERKLYYREMIARFAHHNAIMWNIAEEYNHPDLELDNAEVASWAAEVRRLDIYDNPVTIHPRGPKADLTVWKDLAGNVERTYAVYDDDPNISQHFDHASWQIGSKVHTRYLDGSKSDRSFKVLPAGGLGDFVERWRKATENTGKKVVHIDEAMPPSTHNDELMRFFCRQDASGNWLTNKVEIQHPELCGNPETTRFMMSVGHSFVRKNMTYPVLFSGGGVEYILEQLFSTDNFREYEALWNYTRYAREFLETLPFAEMEPHDELLRYEAGSGEVLAKIGEAYAVYLPAVRDIQSIYLAGNTEFIQTWMNPRTGNEIFAGNIQTSGNGELVAIAPPSGVTLGDDWAVKFEAVGNTVQSPNAYVSQPTVFLEQGGIVVMEAESGDPTESGNDASTGYWALENRPLGGGNHTGEGYYNWLIDKQIKCAPAAEAAGKLIYKFKISEDYTGDYYLQLRSWHGSPAPAGDQENDAWTKIDNGGWHKTSSTGALNNLNKWTWKTSRRHDPVSSSGTDCPQNGDSGDKDKNRVLIKNLSAGEHTLELTGRSANFRIDRIHLFHESIAQSVGENALLSESPREDLIDADNDGLPDWWELLHFGNLDQDPSGDFDNDGYTNLAEYNFGSDPADPDDPVSDELTTITAQVSASSHDAEQNTNSGNVKLSSGDLEMPLNGSQPQVVGVRFVNLDIPQGATIVEASIQFTADESESSVVSLQVFGQSTDNASAFTTANSDISNRSKTTASYDWNTIPAWVSGRASSAEKTGDLSAIVQEIVNRNGWQPNNAMSFIIENHNSASGATRAAKSYDNDPQLAPELSITYTTAENQAPSVNAGADQILSLQDGSATINLSGVVNDDGLPNPPGTISNLWTANPATVTFGDSNALSTTATFTQAGSYTLTLTADDSQLSASNSLQVTIEDEIISTLDDPFIQSEGIVSMEAEHFHINDAGSGHSWNASSEVQASNGTSMKADPDNGTNIKNNVTTTSPVMRYDIEFTQTGIHYVWLHGLGITKGNTLWVNMDNSAIQELVLDKSQGWSWSNGKDGNVITVNVDTLGVKTFNVWMREDGVSVDKIVLTDDVTFIPSGFGPPESERGRYIQDDGLQGLLLFEAKNHHGNTAQGNHHWDEVILSGSNGLIALPDSEIVINSNIETTSPRLDYNVKFVKTGIHYVWVRGHANGAANDDSLYVGLDGSVDALNQKLTFNQAADWSWSNDRHGGGRVTIDVQAIGNHTINIWMREDGTAFDEVIISSDPNFVPTNI